MDGTAKGQDAALAIVRLPARQREALELRERDGLSHGEIATRLGTSHDAIPQLIAHARINLYDELHGTILASVAPSSECERVLGLIAARQDGELDPGSAEAAWLDAHLTECQRCERGVEEMRAASAAYRDSAAAAALPGSPPAPAPRRRLALALAAGALLLFAGAATAFVRDDSPSKPAEPAAEVADRSKSPARGAVAKGKDGKKAGAREGRSKEAARQAASSDGTAAAAPTPSTAPTTSEVPVAAPDADRPENGDGGGGSANRPSGDTAVDPPQRTAAPKPKASPTATGSPTPAPTSSPASAPLAEPPPPEEPAEETSRRREPPGKPADHPKK